MLTRPILPASDVSIAGRLGDMRLRILTTTYLVLVSSISVPPAWADVVELRNGQRVEGTFKGADDSAVRIEIGIEA